MIAALRLQFWLAIALRTAQLRGRVEHDLTRVHTAAMRRALGVES